MTKKVATILILVFTISSCDYFKSDTEKYFDDTFNLISQNSIKKSEINWRELEQKVRDSIKTFNNDLDVQRGIAYALKLVNDGHSSLFVAPIKSKKNRSINPKKNNSKAELPTILTKMIENNIGYIKLNGFPLINDSLRKLYPIRIRESLLELDKTDNLSGWIIDLRENSGGELTVESLGLAPLFENSLIGIVMNNENEFIDITCTNNKFKYGNKAINEISIDFGFRNSGKKIAILISNKTASAGEFLTLAFKKFQNRTKTFGQKTSGKTSSTKLHRLRNNAILFLTETYLCNPDKTLVKDKLYPDIECSSEETLSKAINWIKNAL